MGRVALGDESLFGMAAAGEFHGRHGIGDALSWEQPPSTMTADRTGAGGISSHPGLFRRRDDAEQGEILTEA